MKTLANAVTMLLLALCSTLLPAQVRQPDFSAYGGSIPAKINGVIQVAAFDYDAPSDFAGAVGQWSNFSNGCSYNVPGYGSNQPFSASAKVTVTDLSTSANTETVTLTAVNSTSAPNCNVSLNTSNSHTGRWRLQSGTCGLKEAILIFGGASSNYAVGQAFYDRGCSASTITGANATGAASGSFLFDQSNGKNDIYVSNGTNFALVGSFPTALPTDGYFTIAAPSCSISQSGDTETVASVLKVVGNIQMVQETTTTTTATDTVICAVVVPSRLTSGRGVTINDVTLRYGNSTGNIATCNAPTLGTQTAPTAATSETAASATLTSAGSVTVTPVVGSCNTAAVSAGQVYSEKIALSTPLAVNTDLTVLYVTQSFIGPTNATFTMNVAGVDVHYKLNNVL